MFANECMRAASCLGEGEKVKKIVMNHEIAKVQTILEAVRTRLKYLTCLKNSAEYQNSRKIGTQNPGIIQLCWNNQSGQVLRTEVRVL